MLSRRSEPKSQTSFYRTFLDFKIAKARQDLLIALSKFHKCHRWPHNDNSKKRSDAKQCKLKKICKMRSCYSPARRSVLGKTVKMGRDSPVNTIFFPKQNQARGFATNHAKKPSQFAGKIKKNSAQFQNLSNYMF